MDIIAVLKKAVRKYTSTSLILRILIGIIIGASIALIVRMQVPDITDTGVPENMTWLLIMGDLFVGGLKAIAPVLVFVLVSSALAQSSSRLD